MTDNDAKRAATLLAEFRASIDRMDTVLVYTLAERFRATKAVGRLKAAHHLPAADPTREAHQIKRLKQLAMDADLDPIFAEKFLTFIIDEVVKNHQTYQSDSNAD